MGMGLLSVGCCNCGGSTTTTVGVIPGCSCSPIPTPLTMTSSDESCNFDMFQTGTISWQIVPPDLLPTQIGVMQSDGSYYAFLGDQEWPDPVAGGAMFLYYLTCGSNQISLSRVYPTSPFGSPYIDEVLYTWLIGGAGNTCTPFSLTGGTAFSGSDLSCCVTLAGTGGSTGPCL